jgi:hypothetical protein
MAPDEGARIMTTSLRVHKLGWSVSALLAMAYVIAILGSLLLVGHLTTRSWQAAFLGIRWETVAGFEIGLLVVVLLGFAIALVPTLVSNFSRRRLGNELKSAAPSSEARASPRKSWAFRLLVACLVLPALALIILRASAPLISSGTPERSLG